MRRHDYIDPCIVSKIFWNTYSYYDKKFLQEEKSKAVEHMNISIIQ